MQPSSLVVGTQGLTPIIPIAWVSPLNGCKENCVLKITSLPSPCLPPVACPGLASPLKIVGWLHVYYVVLGQSINHEASVFYRIGQLCRLNELTYVKHSARGWISVKQAGLPKCHGVSVQGEGVGMAAEGLGWMERSCSLVSSL